jgi:hypothetical protein
MKRNQNTVSAPVMVHAAKVEVRVQLYSFETSAPDIVKCQLHTTVALPLESIEWEAPVWTPWGTEILVASAGNRTPDSK